jgi:hypothetical protein
MTIMEGLHPELDAPAEARAADLRQRRQLEESVSGPAANGSDFSGTGSA